MSYETATNNTRNSKQLNLVLNVVNHSMDHPDAMTIYNRCKEKSPKISMGTVYRNLSKLSKKCQILQLPMPTGPDHYDFNIKPHSHFFCRFCNRVFDFTEPEIMRSGNFEISIPKAKVEGYSLVVYGICEDCLKNNKSLSL